jgi:hypothetical protein
MNWITHLRLRIDFSASAVDRKRRTAAMLKTKPTAGWHQIEPDFGILPDEGAGDSSIHGNARSNGSNATVPAVKTMEVSVGPDIGKGLESSLAPSEAQGCGILEGQPYGPAL